MLRPLAHTLLSAAALALLGGCTVTVYSSSNPPPAPPRKAAQPQAAAAKPAMGRRPATPTVHTTTTTTTTATDNTTGSPTSRLAPAITAPIAFGNGKGGAFRGQAYVIPESTRQMPDFSTMVPFATLYTDSFDIKTQEFAGGFPGALVQEDWFGIRYEGAISVPSDGRYQFKVISDDGAVLSIDNEKVVDNDGRHLVREATGQKELKAGKHAVRLDYFQALKGTVALQVYMVEGGKDKLLVGVK